MREINKILKAIAKIESVLNDTTNNLNWDDWN